MKNFKPIGLFIFAIFIGLNALNANAADDKGMTDAQKKEAERCVVPAFAKAIGHKELWKKHNGCETDKKKDDE